MLDAAKSLGHMSDHIILHQALHHGDGGHVIFHVVDTGDENVLHRQNGRSVAADNPIIQAHVRLSLPGEEPGGAVAPELRRDGVVGVENQKAAFVLVTENVGFCLDVLLHILVNVQMVGSQIGNHRPGRAVGHVHQLEGAQLHHGVILSLHLPYQGQQRGADVATQPDGFSRCLQHFRNQGCGGGFSIGPGHTQQSAGTYFKENLHLRGHLGPTGPQGFNGRVCRVHSRGTEHHIRLHTVQIPFPHVKLAAHLLQLQYFLVQLLPRRLVAAQNLAAKFQQQTNQRPVAHAQSQHCNSLAPKIFKIAFKCRTHHIPHFSEENTPGHPGQLLYSIYTPGRFCKTFDF